MRCLRHRFFYMFPSQLVLPVFRCLILSTSIQPHPYLVLLLLVPLLLIFISLFLLPPTRSHTSTTCDYFPSTCHVICLDWTSSLKLLTSLPHRSLNGLFSTTISPPLLLLFPLPSLSISLGGPAFLPGFCRPRCENWRWRGRRRTKRRSGNQPPRPQSLFLRHFLWQLAPQWSPPSNRRPSLSTRSSSAP